MVHRHYNTWQPIRGYQGRIIGQSDGHIFKKTIRGSGHLLRSPKAIAIDADVYDRDIALSHQQIEVYDAETEKLHQSSIENFNRHRGELDRGCGRQYYLTFSRWKTTNLSPDAPRQLSLDLGTMNA